ncbi:cob(I)yrinic acid a,c-diamide adenosyltransferase [Hyphomicrobium methylovorum]|uniref:cob(I)yrinic acid a,c-diamide adenosyltransferase n=1 Tax=Hyphomicrobium methylovorum TaxID=84 RepID=UPI0015E72E8A|nr:cob(I)yrinic acid a,c-diamide adenosyltransferase [Hyphomicrobium methylovorum]MBA2126301.1 cob(I)yrinic acid a,c-diamide adenosyltransferase [Hyphomicrobium methylovorum]
MVVLNRIYTKTGDAGTTALGSGERVPKTSPRIAAYGTVDETNALIGVARTHVTEADADVDAMLHRVQNDLFDLGADLCVPDRGKELPYEPLRVADGQVKRLEDEIDLMNGALQPLRSFILPGGSSCAAALHVARTVSRRAERLMVELAAIPDEPVSAPALKYINRLSDFLFVAARYVNDHGKADVLWVPGKNR